MSSNSSEDRNRLFRAIPKVDVLLEKEAIAGLAERFGRGAVLYVIRKKLEELRAEIGGCAEDASRELPEEIQRRISSLVPDIVRETERLHTPKLRRVINGTGTILHTNLGRAPLSRAYAEQLTGILSGYSNLEYKLEEGERGDRCSPLTELLCHLTGAEDALVVNNNAAAVLLLLHTLARGREVIVSRGELVEVGGKFRIPDVMEESGALLKEVGTTNKTHVSDYEAAISEETAAIMKVHTSNYRILGFTGEVSVKELGQLARSFCLPLIEDLGSGVLLDLERYGLHHEPTVREAIRAGADLVTFSGDKLLGGPQAGIIAGRRCYIEKLRRSQLLRALRIDKFTAAALELTLLSYLDENEALRSIPVLGMITGSPEAMEEKARRLLCLLKSRIPEGAADLTAEPCASQVGGGSLPLERIASFCVVVHPRQISSMRLAERLRRRPLPVIGRLAEDGVRLDVRTMDEEDFEELAKEMAEALMG